MRNMIYQMKVGQSRVDQSQRNIQYFMQFGKFNKMIKLIFSHRVIFVRRLGE